MAAAVLLHAILMGSFFTSSANHHLVTGSRAVIEVQQLKLEVASTSPSPASTSALSVDSVQRTTSSSSHGKTPDREESPSPRAVISEKVDLPDSEIEFLPTSALDRRPLPVSEPDAGMLDGVASTGFPIKLRLFIDKEGHVLRIDILAADTGDMQFVERLKQMFFATRYIPGRLNGLDVSAFIDIQLNVATLPAAFGVTSRNGYGPPARASANATAALG